MGRVKIRGVLLRAQSFCRIAAFLALDKWVLKVLRMAGYCFFVGEGAHLILVGLVVSRQALFEILFALAENLIADVSAVSKELD